MLIVGFSAGLLHASEITTEKSGSVVRFAIEGKTICDYQMQPGEVPEGVSETFKHGAH
jgi:hypothetical protein